LGRKDGKRGVDLWVVIVVIVVVVVVVVIVVRIAREPESHCSKIAYSLLSVDYSLFKNLHSLSLTQHIPKQQKTNNPPSPEAMADKTNKHAIHLSLTHC
jgi:hypothetical protein